MIRRSLALLMLLTAIGMVAVAQTTAPESRNFSFFFDGDGAYLGVQTVDVTRENYAKFGLREVRGVAVVKVVENSPAAAAGLQAGDVIVRLNGEAVESSRKLTRLIGEIAPDHQVRITVLRGGSERELTATLAKRPMPTFREGNFRVQVPDQNYTFELPPTPDYDRSFEFTPPAPQWDDKTPFHGFTWSSGNSRQIGVGVTPLTKQLAEHFGVSGGLLINNVRENSAAAKAGLKAGDVITEADGRPLNGEFDLIRAIAEKKAGDVALTVYRGGKSQTVRVTPEDVKGDQFFKVPDGSFGPAQFKFNMLPVKPEFKFAFPPEAFKFPVRVI